MKKLIVFLLIIICINTTKVFANDKVPEKFTLPPLKYSYDALEPYIDKKTMIIHHDKHHGTYVDNLNKALEKYPEYYKFKIDELLLNLDKLPEEIRETVKNNGGGHYNHSLFWEVMGPNGKGEPKGNILKAIEKDFTSFEKFKEEFKKAALSRFGSGWVWLLKDQDGNLKIVTTANQDIPDISRYKPVLLLDVWEHAYYLKYLNKRADYIDNWWNVVNWDKVEELYNKNM